jgi:hypothetical protein
MPRPNPAERSLPVCKQAHPWWGVLLLVAATAVIWFALIDVPQPPDGSLDGSWQAVMMESHAQHWQFGKEVIFTFGPWGFLAAHFVPPGFLATKWIWEICSKLALAVAFVALSRRLAGPRRGLFLVCLPVFATLFTDTAFILFIALAVQEWLFEPETSPAIAAAALAALAFLAQVKFTYCLVAATGVGAAAWSLVWRGHWRRALGSAAGFAAAFLILWLAADQNPVRIAAFFSYSWEVAKGYSGAMGLQEADPVFLCGVGVMLLNVLFLAQVWRTRTDRAFRWPIALFLGATWTLAWKHGFTRADGHVFGFFGFSLLMALALPGRPPLFRRGDWFYVNAACCLAGMWFADAGLLRWAPRLLWFRATGVAQDISRPLDFSRTFATAALDIRNAASMPRLRAAVGRGTVDLIDFEQGLLLLNGLNYDPRPIFQGYSAYTPRLLSKNLGFYQSERAPEFVLVRLGAIDGRISVEDDSLVLAEIPRRYDLASLSSDGLLFRRKGTPPATRFFSREPVFESEVALGSELQLPAPDGHAVLMQADFPLSRVGRLRSLLYKPPELTLATTDYDGRETRYRLIPGIAAEGFLLQPLLQTTEDYAAFARGTGLKWVRLIRVEPAAGEAEFWLRGKVRLFRIPELAVVPAGPMRRTGP